MRNTVFRRVFRIFTHGTFPRFLAVGGTGFLIDATILFLLIRMVELGPSSSRVSSFSIAVLSTWFLNRVWTFEAERSSKPLAELLRYVAVQLTGGAVNLLLYVMATLAVADPFLGPALGLVAGSAEGATADYCGARFIAFAPRSNPVARR